MSGICMWFTCRPAGLLGLDFLYHHNYAHTGDTLVLDGRTLKCELVGEALQTAQFTVGADTIVPAGCQCIVGGRVDVNGFRSRYSLNISLWEVKRL